MSSSLLSLFFFYSPLYFLSSSPLFFSPHPPSLPFSSTLTFLTFSYLPYILSPLPLLSNPAFPYCLCLKKKERKRHKLCHQLILFFSILKQYRKFLATHEHFFSFFFFIDPTLSKTTLAKRNKPIANISPAYDNYLITCCLGMHLSCSLLANNSIISLKW